MSTEIVMPRLSDTMDKGTIAKWNKSIGESVKRGEVLVEIETDKANMELESYADGFLAQIIIGEGRVAAVGDPIGIVAQDESELKLLSASDSEKRPNTKSNGQAQPASQPTDSQSNAVRAAAPKQETQEPPHTERVKASPLARKLAVERGLNLADVHGTGPHGRVVRSDVERASEFSEPDVSPKPMPDQEDRIIELSRMQQAVGRRLTESMQTTPHFYVTVSIDMSNAMELRRQLNASGGMQVSFNDLIVKATATTLRTFQNINASYHGDGSVLQHGSVNIGIAVDLAAGLVVPVLKHADHLGLTEVAAQSRELIKAARSGTLTQSQIEGGTFTVSNLGMLGVGQFTAIINPPQAAIMAVGAIKPQAMVVEGRVEVRSMMCVTLSCDHRIVYGAEAARFLGELTRLLENPVLMVIGESA